jgi:beta-glucosidase-like glycosyl hydrolase
MNAHLSIPAIDSSSNKPTSISYKSVTTLLRNEMNYQGLTFTDALEMQGVRNVILMEGLGPVPNSW